MSRICEYKRSLDYSQPIVQRVAVAASQTIVGGDLLVVSSGKMAKAGAAATKVFGIAMSDITTGVSVDDTNTVDVIVLSALSVFRIKFSNAGTKKTLTSADLYGTAFDIDANQVVLLDDVTGGFLMPIGFNNDNLTADVIVKASALWNA